MIRFQHLHVGPTHELNENKIGCTNHIVTLNYVVNLGMELELRCIPRLRACNSKFLGLGSCLIVILNSLSLIDVSNLKTIGSSGARSLERA